QRQEKAQRAGCQVEKAVMAVEARGIIVLRVDDKGYDTNARAHRAAHRIPQQCGSEATALVRDVNRQSSKQRHRHDGIARQATSDLVGHLLKQHAARRQCVIPGNDGRPGGMSDVADGDSPAHVLTGLLPEIAVKRGHAAGKSIAIVRTIELHDDEARHFDRTISASCACLARRSASAGSGGVSRASTNCDWTCADRRMTRSPSMVRRAASCAADTTKSLTLRPSSSAAFFTNCRASGAMRASSRALLVAVSAMTVS